MQTTRIVLHPSFVIGAVDRRIFGGFLEHMGRSVYDGVYRPQSKHADAHGNRTDVLEALRALGLSVVRYPGGNFVSGYHWRDGVGPRAQRPTVRELAWQSIETNQFGTDEFIRWCKALRAEPMLAVNLGTGTPEEARDWVEYCNAPAGTRLSDQRVANGSTDPHDVKLWCLGNEMDGPWQLGHVPAEHYAIRAQQAAKMMKDCDGYVRVVACGSSAPEMATYLEWDRTVLEHLGGLADFISLHRYVGNPSGNTADYLAVTNSIDRQIEQVDAVCRYVQARRKSRRRAYLCFDEWNVWYKARRPEDMNGRGRFAPPLVEEVYSLEDALVVAGFLMSFLRHADVVKVANLAQLVNVIGPLLTRDDELLIQSIYWPFQMIAARGHGVSLRPAVSGPRYDSEQYGAVHTLDTAAVWDESTGRVSVFLTNRSLTEPAPFAFDWHGARIAAAPTAELVTAASAQLANSWDAPHRVVKCDLKRVSGGEHNVEGVLPPLSFAAVDFTVEPS